MKIRRFNESTSNILSEFKDRTIHIAESLKDNTTGLNYNFYWYDDTFEAVHNVDDNKIIKNSDITDKHTRTRIDSGEKIYLLMGITIHFEIGIIGYVMNNIDSYISIDDLMSQASEVGDFFETMKSMSDQFDDTNYRKTVYIDKTLGITSICIEIIDIKNKVYI